MGFITIVSGHYPSSTHYATLTKQILETYCQRNHYDFYYDNSEPDETEMHALHFRRCEIIQKAALQFPETSWFLWLDSDVYILQLDRSIESCIDLNEHGVLYHTFHEAPWGSYPINTGVKFVHINAINYEQMMWNIRNTPPWNTFPYEQKALYEYIFPQIPGQFKIHDPYVLNCITQAYPDKIKDALFIHLCAMSSADRNVVMQQVINHLGNQIICKSSASPRKIIGYFHVCQKEGWEICFARIFQEIKQSGLYDATDEIRCVIVNNSDSVISHPCLTDPKMCIIYQGNSLQYERPTLLHMRRAVDVDESCVYWYVHTKGLRWMNTPKEQNVVDWVQVLLHWNITKWKEAEIALKTHDVYGCNHTGVPVAHYSGNFWWATSAYVQNLPDVIGNGYNDPKFWLFINQPSYCNSFSSGLEGMGHYDHPFPKSVYA